MRLNAVQGALIAMAVWARALPAQDIGGCWVGGVGAGNVERRAAIEFTGGPTGWRGALHVLSGTLDTDSLSEIRASGGAITFTAPTREGRPSFRGGVQRLWLGNLKAGEHEVTAFFTGQGPHQRDYKRGTTLKVEKGVGAK